MPFHPSVIHFPIVLICLSCLGYVLFHLYADMFWRRLATLLHLLGLFSFALAIFTGSQAESAIPHPAELHAMIERHALLSWVGIWVYGVLYIWQLLRIQKWQVVEKWGFSLIFTGMLGVTLFSAHLGGRMVYEKGAGVLPMENTLREEVNLKK